jgi:hypothetical protein
MSYKLQDTDYTSLHKYDMKICTSKIKVMWMCGINIQGIKIDTDGIFIWKISDIIHLGIMILELRDDDTEVIQNYADTSHQEQRII